MSLVLLNIDLPPPSPAGKCVLPPQQRQRGGWGVQYFGDERHGLPFYSNNLSTQFTLPLCVLLLPCIFQLNKFSSCRSRRGHRRTPRLWHMHWQPASVSLACVAVVPAFPSAWTVSSQPYLSFSNGTVAGDLLTSGVSAFFNSIWNPFCKSFKSPRMLVARILFLITQQGTGRRVRDSLTD